MIIIPKRIGQLGNQLFHIAHFAASSIEHSYAVRYCNFGSSQISVTSWCHIQAATVKQDAVSEPIERAAAPGIRLDGWYF